MNVFMRGEHAVPIIVAKRQVKKEPKIVKTRKFVGLRDGLSALTERVIDIVLECFWEAENEVLDKGDSDVIHYAIDVSDTPGSSSPELVVTKLDGNARPGCGAYFEIITVVKDNDQEGGPAPPIHPASKAKLVNPKTPRPNPGQSSREQSA